MSVHAQTPSATSESESAYGAAFCLKARRPELIHLPVILRATNIYIEKLPAGSRPNFDELSQIYVSIEKEWQKTQAEASKGGGKLSDQLSGEFGGLGSLASSLVKSGPIGAAFSQVLQLGAKHGLDKLQDNWDELDIRSGRIDIDNELKNMKTLEQEVSKFQEYARQYPSLANIWNAYISASLGFRLGDSAETILRAVPEFRSDKHFASVIAKLKEIDGKFQKGQLSEATARKLFAEVAGQVNNANKKNIEIIASAGRVEDLLKASRDQALRRELRETLSQLENIQEQQVEIVASILTTIIGRFNTREARIARASIQASLKVYQGIRGYIRTIEFANIAIEQGKTAASAMGAQVAKAGATVGAGASLGVVGAVVAAAMVMVDAFLMHQGPDVHELILDQIVALREQVDSLARLMEERFNAIDRQLIQVLENVSETLEEVRAARADIGAVQYRLLTLQLQLTRFEHNTYSWFRFLNEQRLRDQINFEICLNINGRYTEISEEAFKDCFSRFKAWAVHDSTHFEPKALDVPLTPETYANAVNLSENGIEGQIPVLARIANKQFGLKEYPSIANYVLWVEGVNGFLDTLLAWPNLAKKIDVGLFQDLKTPLRELSRFIEETSTRDFLRKVIAYYRDLTVSASTQNNALSLIQDALTSQAMIFGSEVEKKRGHFAKGFDINFDGNGRELTSFIPQIDRITPCTDAAGKIRVEYVDDTNVYALRGEQPSFGSIEIQTNVGGGGALSVFSDQALGHISAVYRLSAALGRGRFEVCYSRFEWQNPHDVMKFGSNIGRNKVALSGFDGPDYDSTTVNPSAVAEALQRGEYHNFAEINLDSMPIVDFEFHYIDSDSGERTTIAKWRGYGPFFIDRIRFRGWIDVKKKLHMKGVGGTWKTRDIGTAHAVVPPFSTDRAKHLPQIVKGLNPSDVLQSIWFSDKPSGFDPDNRSVAFRTMIEDTSFRASRKTGEKWVEKTAEPAANFGTIGAWLRQENQSERMNRQALINRKNLVATKQLLLKRVAALADGKNDSELALAFKRINGAKTLLQAYFSIGAPLLFQSDDPTHALLNGAPGIALPSGDDLMVMMLSGNGRDQLAQSVAAESASITRRLDFLESRLNDYFTGVETNAVGPVFFLPPQVMKTLYRANLVEGLSRATASGGNK